MNNKTSLIRKEMKVNEIILSFPPQAQKIRRTIRNFATFPNELPQESLETFLNKHGKNQSEIDPFVEKLNAILDEQVSIDQISFTAKASAKIKSLLNEENKNGWGIKYADQLAHCGAGFEYILEPCQGPTPNDITFYSQGIEIYTPRESIKRLIGSLIDYEEGFIDDNFQGFLKLGFTILNPNVKSTCDCGCSTGYGA